VGGTTGGLISRQAAERVAGIYKSIPGGIVLEGKLGDLGSVGSVRYEPVLNAFVLDDRAAYFSPIPAHSAAVLARAIDEDDRIGVSVDPVVVYGMVSKHSDVVLDLMLTDKFLAGFVFDAEAQTAGYRLENGFNPYHANYDTAKATVLFTFTNFQFAIHDEELQLTGANFYASIVPLAARRATDGANLPDLNAISARGALSADVTNAVLNATHVGENFNYYRREMIVARALAYGEIAALFRGLKDARVDLQELARRIEETTGGLGSQRSSSNQGPSNALELEAPWLEYLKDIQVRDQYANWVGPPYDIVKTLVDCKYSITDVSLSIPTCTNAINQGKITDKKTLALAYLYRGNVYLVDTYYDLAIADYNSAIEIDQRYDFTYYMRGKAWHGKDNLDRAIADYTKAIELNPRDMLAYNDRGVAWNQKGNKQRAAADFRQALVIDPSYMLPRRGLEDLRTRH
jgi:tetratricopeptide (TPR) repeat protein